MRSAYIPSFHYRTDKLSNDWCKTVANAIFNHSGMRSLLQGKDTKEIDEYMSGNIDMRTYKKMFKSIGKQLEKADREGGTKNAVTRERLKIIDQQFQPLPMITVKVNTAISITSKIPFDISCKTRDNLATDKKEKDFNYLKNLAKIKAVGQELSDQLSQGIYEPEGTKFSNVKYKSVPLDLDLTDTFEAWIFRNIIYKLAPETAYELALSKIFDKTEMPQLRNLITKDLFRYGCYSLDTQDSQMVGLPAAEYRYPQDVFVQHSFYNDFRDNSYRYVRLTPTVEEFYNMFANEIGSRKELDEVIKSYNKKRNVSISYGDYNTYKLEVRKFMCKSIDKVTYKEDEDGNKMLVDDREGDESIKAVWGQNTYLFYHLADTDFFYGKEKLGYAHREKGNEAFTTFPTICYRAQEKSAVEQCIGENKKAIIAEIKMMYSIIKSAGNGKYVDLKFIKNAALALKREGEDIVEVIERLLDHTIEENNMIGSSEGMDGKQENGNFLPVREIQGGLRNDITGYMSVIQQAAANITRFTGINDELAGLNNNANLLNFARKLNVENGMNTIQYALEGTEYGFKKVLGLLAYGTKKAVEEGGILKTSLEQFIGKENVDTIDDIDKHDFDLLITLGLREEERREFEKSLAILEQKGLISQFQKLIVNQTSNPKERLILLAVIEKKAEIRSDAIRQEQYASQQQIEQQRGQNQQNVEMARGEVEANKIRTKGEVEAQLAQLTHQLGLQREDFVNLQKRLYQGDRLMANRERDLLKHQLKSDEKRDDVTEPVIPIMPSV